MVVRALQTITGVLLTTTLIILTCVRIAIAGEVCELHSANFADMFIATNHRREHRPWSENHLHIQNHHKHRIRNHHMCHLQCNNHHLNTPLHYNLTNKAGLERHLRESESLAANSDDVAIWELVSSHCI